MAKPFGGKRPQDLRHTLRRFMDYLGRHKIMLGVVGLLAAVSALAALLGTYMIRPIVNGVLENGSAAYLAGVVALTAGIYIVSAEIKRISDQYKMEEDKVRELVNVDDLKKDLAINKAIDFIKSHANIVEKAAEEEKAADAE